MTTPLRPRSFTDLQVLLGQTIGPTGWQDVTQDAIDLFAAATDDHQWIHVDPQRAANGPFGTTVAHGLYSLSISPELCHQLIAFDGFALSLNYGYDRIRFPTPVPVGSRLRLSMAIIAADQVAGGIQIRISQTMELEGSTKPALVAESIARVVLADG